MKKNILASLCLLIASLSFGQTFTINSTKVGDAWPNDERGVVISCPQGATAAKTSGSLVEALVQANLGNINKIVFDPAIFSYPITIDFSVRWSVTGDICRDNLKITGPVDGNGKPLVTIASNTNISSYLFTFKGNGVKISNINFSKGKTIVTGSNDTITNCNFRHESNDKYDLLVLKGAIKPIVTNCTFFTQQPSENDRHALYITAGTKDPYIYNCKFDQVFNGVYAGNYPGDGFTGTTQNIIFKKNTISNVTNNGLYFYNGTKTALIDSNTISNSEFGNMYIRDMGVNSNVIISNNFTSYSKKSAGIYVEGSQNVIIKNNTSSFNHEDGIHVDVLSNYTTISNCKLFSNNGSGAYFTSSNFCSIDSCYIYGNDTCGIKASTSDNLLITNNKIGLSENNVISGNKKNGVEILGGNLVKVGLLNKGNIILASGTNGLTLDKGNGISFGLGSGVLPSNSSIKSNLIGVDASYTNNSALGSQRAGIIFLSTNSDLNSGLNDTIGGHLAGEGNILGNNGVSKGSGISAIQLNLRVRGVNIIQNYVGISPNGDKIGNFYDGIALKGARYNTVFKNIVGNNGTGITLRDDDINSVTSIQSNNNTIIGNYCGTSNGNDSHPNSDHGISIEWGSNNNTIGGVNMSDANIIMNEIDGVWVAGNPSNGSNPSNQNKILGNKIINCNKGISIENTTKNLQINTNYLNKNTVGISFTGAAQNPIVQSNTIDSSVTNGIEINAGVVSYKSLNNKIQNTSAGNGVYVNYAITNAEFRTDTLQFNNNDGYKFEKGTLVIIGGTSAGEGNVIKGNKGNGINLAKRAVNNVQMRRNSISCNGGTGIRLLDGANTEFYVVDIKYVDSIKIARDSIVYDTLASTIDTIVGVVNVNRPYAGGIVEIYKEGPECKQTCTSDFGRQGHTFIASGVTGADGKFKIAISGAGVTDPKTLTYTVTTKNATNTTGAFSTSEFSRCTNILPVNFYKFNATKTSQGIVLDWKTAQEANNDYFVVEKSTDGIHFFAISSPIEGAGFSNSILSYSFIDNNPNDEINYYRIKQVDYDGKYDHSKTVAVNMGTGNLLLIYPNPTKEDVTIKVVDESSNTYNIIVYNAIGQEIFNSEMEIYESYAEKNISLEHLAKGIYTVHITSEKDTWVKKIIKE